MTGFRLYFLCHVAFISLDVGIVDCCYILHALLSLYRYFVDSCHLHALQNPCSQLSSLVDVDDEVHKPPDLFYKRLGGLKVNTISWCKALTMCSSTVWMLPADSA